MKTNLQEQLNQAAQILINKEAKKSSHSFYPFTGIQDFKLNEVEMLEFLLSNCHETIQTLSQIAEAYENPTSVCVIISRTMYALNKTYKFGFLNRSKCIELDTYSDISEIQMKERHLPLLNKLRELDHETDSKFIEAYNQTHQHLNPFRVEQVFFYLNEQLEYKGIKCLPYKIYSDAMIHSFSADWKPYFCLSNYGYYIIDNDGHYAGEFNIHSKEESKGEFEWGYMASVSPSRTFTKESADIKVKQNEVISKIAGFDGLSWRVVYANCNDIKDSLMGLNYNERIGREYVHQSVNIPKGKRASQLRMIKELNIIK